MQDQSPVAILGAGINGIAIARELLLNDVPVVLIDKADVACGATAYSSRLIHGGLRYLEYGEFRLVRESLHERTRLLRLAPHLVKPLRLFIPVHGRLNGAWNATKRIVGLETTTNKQRGAWLVRIGLWLYDRYARDPTLPKHHTYRVGHAPAPPVNAQRYDVVCSYYDCQLRFPERFCQAMLADCRRIAGERGVAFELHTYHLPRLNGNQLMLRQIASNYPGEPSPVDDSSPESCLQPAMIINATGAWVDQTLSALPVESRRLMGGTKGTHFVTRQAVLKELLGDDAIYAEAEDGRPFFILPFGESVLVGTTDIPYSGDPYDAVATEAELEYLIQSLNQIFPQVNLARSDLLMHYCGVRPLPAAKTDSPSSVSRDHEIHWHETSPLPVCSIIGGKLTTCRALAEQTAESVLSRLGRPRVGDSRDRSLPGAVEPEDAAALRDRLSNEQFAALFELLGWQTLEIVRELDFPAVTDLSENIIGTNLPKAIIAWVIRNEAVATLDDLVERRLMLLYHHPLIKETLEQLAQLLVEAGKVPAERQAQVVDVTVDRLKRHFGIVI